MRDEVIVTIDADGNTSVEAGDMVKGHRCEDLVAAFSGLGRETKHVRKPQFQMKDTAQQGQKAKQI